MRKLVPFFTLCACLILNASLVAQTYTFVGGGGNDLWTNPNNWNPVGVPPDPLTAGTIVIAADCTQDINRVIRSGAYLTIDAGATLIRNSNTLSIRGTMTINGTLTNNTTLAITSTGTLINNGTIDNGNSATDFINNSGTIENNGVLNILNGRLNNQASGTFHNNSMGSITVAAGAQVNNQNQMDNAGTITNNGTMNAAGGSMDLFTNTGTITNNGALNVAETFDNNGIIINYNNITVNGNGTFNNNASGTITNTLGGTVTNNNIFNNAGTFTNDGTLKAASGANDVFNNTGTLNNTLNIDIGSGTLSNAPSGTINNNTGGTLTVSNNGTLTNDGLFNNNSLVTNNNNIVNTGTFNNNSGGVLNNGNGSGDLLLNTGVLNNNSGATITNSTGATINNTNGGSFNNNGNFNNNGTLPIELLSFIGKVQNEVILLKWETASEKENAYMAVERSRDGIHFQEIGGRKGAGTTSIRQTYTFSDTFPLFGINYYRLRQVDADGKPTYHDIIAVEFGGKIKEPMRLYPTQTSQDITIVSQTLPVSGSTLQIFDASGKLVQQKPWDTEATQQIVNVSALPSGTYFITLRSGKNLQTLRFMRL